MKSFCTFLYYSVLLCTTLYYSVLLCALSTTLYYSVLLFTTLYYSVLLCTTLYCSLLLPYYSVSFSSAPPVVSAWSARGRRVDARGGNRFCEAMADLSAVDNKNISKNIKQNKT